MKYTIWDVCFAFCCRPYMRMRRRTYKLGCICVVLVLILVVNLFDGPVNYRIDITETLARTCTPKRNVVFLKVHKCASSTIANIIVRRGLYIDGATFGLPKQDPAHIGWPNSILPEHILRPRNSPVNILTHHFIYNRTTLQQIMPADTLYIAMIREPFSHFQSTIHYFREIKQLGLKDYDRVHEFLSSPRKYEKKVKMYIGVSPPAYHSLTRNLMSSEFGLQEKDMNDVAKIEEFVDSIDNQFHLVLIYEYFYESVVLMRRLLCWRFRDVIFRTVNFKFHYSTWGTKRDHKLYEQWSLADHKLYKRLNATFWRKVAMQADDFRDEVGRLRDVNLMIRGYCGKYEDTDKKHILKSVSGSLPIDESMWNEAFIITHDDCENMKKRPDNFYHDLLRSNHNTMQMLWVYFYNHFLKF